MTKEIRRIPEGYIREVQRIAAEECANCDEGSCLLLDDGEPSICPQSISHSLWCRYYLTSVLPAHRDLYFKLCGHGSEKRCDLCGKPFYPKSNRGQYCSSCSGKMKRQRTRERVQRFRSAR